jgi:hypothetical protein
LPVDPPMAPGQTNFVNATTARGSSIPRHCVNRPFCTKWAHECGRFKRDKCREAKEGRVVINRTGEDVHEKLKAVFDPEKRARSQANKRALKKAERCAAAANTQR